MRKKIVMSVAMGAICFLTACGDDLSITVPATAESLPIYTDEQTEDGEMSGVEKKKKKKKKTRRRKKAAKRRRNCGPREVQNLRKVQNRKRLP